MRRSLAVFALLSAFVLVAMMGGAPVTAAPGAGAGATILTPNLTGVWIDNKDPGDIDNDGNLNEPDGVLDDQSATDGFPCGGASLPAFDAVSAYLGVGGSGGYAPCYGDIYDGGLSTSPNFATFSGSGVDSAGNAYAITGTGKISGNYTYSEPCQSTPAGAEAATGEAQGTLTLTLADATGIYGSTPVSNATITTSFWWSRVGLTAAVGLKGATITANGGTISGSDANASGLASAVFIPTKSPNCNAPAHPNPGEINIISGTLSLGSA